MQSADLQEALPIFIDLSYAVFSKTIRPRFIVCSDSGMEIIYDQDLLTGRDFAKKTINFLVKGIF